MKTRVCAALTLASKETVFFRFTVEAGRPETYRLPKAFKKPWRIRSNVELRRIKAIEVNRTTALAFQDQWLTTQRIGCLKYPMLTQTVDQPHNL